MNNQGVSGLRKVFLFVVLAFISCLVFGSQLFGVAQANPFFNWQNADADAATIPPTIAFSGVQNDTVYSTRVALSLNVTAPKLATAFNTGIAMVNYTLDNETFEVYSIWSSGSNGAAAGRQTFTYDSPLILAVGNHSLTINALGFVNPSHMSIFYVNSTAYVHFTVASNPTGPSTAVTGDSSVILYVLGVVTAAIIILVAVLAIKRKGSQNPKTLLNIN
jgi:hypothetical protein